MGLRTELQSLLETLTDSVHYQPPTSLEMTYPCIVYKKDNLDTVFANNSPYLLTDRYLVTVIDRDPDSVIPKAVASLPMCLFNRAFVAGNLNHTVFILFF